MEMSQFIRLTQDFFRPTNHSQRRYRQAFATSLTLAFARAAALLSLLVLVPVLLNHLDQRRFGLWMTLSSLTAPMALADFGLGYGLMSATARAQVRAGTVGVQRLVSSAFAAITTIALPLALFLVLAVFLLPLEGLLGASGLPSSEVRWSTLVLVLGLLAAGIPGVAARVQSGLQSGYISSLWTGAATLAGLAATLLGVQAGLSLVGLVACFVGAPLLIAIANAVWYFRFHSPALRPTIAAVSMIETSALFRTGLLFFVLQLCASLTFTTDNLILAAVLGVEAVPAYAVPARLFSCIGIAVAVAVQPLWPAYAEALERDDWQWIRTAFRRSMLLALSMAVIAAGTLYLFRDEVLGVWTQGALYVDDRIVAALAVWSVVDACSVTLAMLFNGLHVVRFQVIISIIMTICSFPARYWLLDYLGPSGLPVATTVVCLITAIIPCFIVLPRILQMRSA
jgi:O-antigen/teichoic acid export membrane protein